MSSLHRTSSRAAFTMVELLAAVAIIAILASLLFPLVANMREKSQAAKCLSNLRQIGLGLAGYAADNDGYNPAMLEEARSLGPPFFAVLGNNDWGLDLPPRLLLERGGRTFLLIHIAPTRIGGTDFLLHGHTHVPRDEIVNGTRVLNPGSVGKANKGAPASWGWLEVSDAGEVTWGLERP